MFLLYFSWLCSGFQWQIWRVGETIKELKIFKVKKRRWQQFSKLTCIQLKSALNNRKIDKLDNTFQKMNFFDNLLDALIVWEWALGFCPELLGRDGSLKRRHRMGRNEDFSLKSFSWYTRTIVLEFQDKQVRKLHPRLFVLKLLRHKNVLEFQD